MKAPEPERIDEDNPEWTDEDFARAVPFPSLPVELQQLLSSRLHTTHDEEAAKELQQLPRVRQ
jgi:hypothetical protein